MHNLLNNYYSRLSEVLEVTGIITQNDLEYCKELSEREFQEYLQWFNSLSVEEIMWYQEDFEKHFKELRG
jgi:hypothetical protein